MEILLINNLKSGPKLRRISVLNSKTVEPSASKSCNLNSIEFPAPCAQTRVDPNGNETRGMESDKQAQLIQRSIRYLLNKTSPLMDLMRNDFSPIDASKLQWEIEMEDIFDALNGLRDDEECLISAESTRSQDSPYMVFTAYKRVDKKIHPVSTQLPPECEVIRQIPEDPLLTLPPLTNHPPEFTPTSKISQERMNELNVNATGFLWPEEEKLFQHVMKLNEKGIAFEDVERGTLKESYFSPYIIPTIPHSPWEYRYIPIPPGLMHKVLEVLKLKIAAGVYEQSQSSYRSRWFVVPKKNGKLRIVHDLQPLNGVTIRDAGMVPIIDDFVEGFAGRQCYTVFDLFWGFDARKIHPKSRGLTAFMTPLGLLQITSLPTGFTNSPAEFQKCMAMVLKDEIPRTANIFIDDLPIKGPATQYLDKHGKPEVLPKNPGIRRFIWEHAQDVHRIMH